MVTRYSNCHFAEAMITDYLIDKQDDIKCSFCGEPCGLVPMEHTLQPDLELTLRRWKDGDCTLDDMFDRVNKELSRSWYEAFKTAQQTLQANSQPLYVRFPGTEHWTEADTTVTTTASPDSETTLEVEKNVTNGDERSSDD